MAEQTAVPEPKFGKMWTETSGRREEFARALLSKPLGECEVSEVVMYLTSLGLDVTAEQPRPHVLAQRQARAAREEARLAGLATSAAAEAR